MRILPQDSAFFDLLDAQIDAVVEAAAACGRLAAEFGQLAQERNALDEIEHRADGITHALANRVDQMFVTPFDKEDISHLSHMLDDIVDYGEAAASRMVIYKVEQPPAALLPLSQRVHEIAALLATLVKGLRHLKERDAIHKRFIEIRRVENESDEVYRQALGQLYELPELTPEALLHLM